MELHHRLPRSAVVLGGPEAVAAARAVAQRVRPHPERLRVALLLTFAATAIGCACFWFVVYQEDHARRTFFPRRDAGGLIHVLAGFGLLTQVLLPITTSLRLVRTARVPVGRTLRLAIAWAGGASAVVVWSFFADAVSPQFALSALALFPAAGVLTWCARAAAKADGG